MLEVARQAASDAVRLEVESHLERCRACDAERARWRLIEMVKDQDPPRLGHGAERRIVDEMVAESRRVSLAVHVPARRRGRWLPLSLSAAALAAAALLAVRLVAPDAPVVAEGEIVDASTSGAVAFGGARVSYQ